MKGLIAKHKPKDIATIEEWATYWNNQSYTLQPLANVLKEMKSGLGFIKPDDFDTPNHYAKLVAEQCQRQLIDKILDMFPETIDKS